jgi:Cu(I)/Ag(I) efflux system protein CusF
LKSLQLAKVLLASACVLAAAPALAQTLGPNEGQVMDVDMQAGEVSIRHGYLPELSMDPMTMVFKVANPSLLKGVKNGDYIRFKAGLVAGQFAVIAIIPLKPKPKQSP